MHEETLKRIAQLEAQVQWLLTRQAGSDGRTLQPLYTMREIADLLRCNERTVRRDLYRLKVPARYLRINTSRRRTRVLYEAEVMELLRRHQGSGSTWTLWDQISGQTPWVGDAAAERRIA
jgi:hypothetical protein